MVTYTVLKLLLNALTLYQTIQYLIEPKRETKMAFANIRGKWGKRW